MKSKDIVISMPSDYGLNQYKLTRVISPGGSRSGNCLIPEKTVFKCLLPLYAFYCDNLTDRINYGTTQPAHGPECAIS